MNLELCVWPFASGLNNAGEVIGFWRAGIPPGVTVFRYNQGRWLHSCAAWPESWDWIDRRAAHCLWAAGQVLRQGGVPVFADSGAYSVIKEVSRGREASALSREHWEVVLANYAGLAAVQRTPGDLWTVLPDVIGSQAETLAQLRRFAGEVRRLLDAQVTPIVVLHHGRRSLARFATDLADTVGTQDLVLGFPVAQGRTSPQQVAETLRDLEITPRGIHLLGIGPKSPRWTSYLRALADVAPAWTVSSDAVAHRALLGRTARHGPLTQEQDEVARLIESTVRSKKPFQDPILRPNFSLREELSHPHLWLSKDERDKILAAAVDDGIVGERVTLSLLDSLGASDASEFARSADRHKMLVFRADPTTALPLWVGFRWEREPTATWMARKLADAYLRTLRVHTTALRKEQAIRRYFTGHRPTRLLLPAEALAVRQVCFTVPSGLQLDLFENLAGRP